MSSYEDMLNIKYEDYYKRKKKTKYYYSIIKGHTPGIYFTWDECREQLKNYTNPIFKKFTSKKDALKYLNEYQDIDIYEIDDEIKSNLSVNKTEIFNEDINKTLFNLEDINIYNDDLYIFINSKYHNKINTSSLYFGIKSVNIKETIKSNEDKSSVLPFYYVLLFLDKYKSKIKEYQKNTKSNIYIVSDSLFTYNLFKYWIFKWSSNGWKTFLERDIICKDEVKRSFLLINKLKLHKINYDLIFFNSCRLPPSDSKDKYMWNGYLISRYLLNESID